MGALPSEKGLLSYGVWGTGMRSEFVLCLYRILDALPGRLPELEHS